MREKKKASMKNTHLEKQGKTKRRRGLKVGERINERSNANKERSDLVLPPSQR
jgi:hypothetical protein